MEATNKNMVTGNLFYIIADRVWKYTVPQTLEEYDKARNIVAEVLGAPTPAKYERRFRADLLPASNLKLDEIIGCFFNSYDLDAPLTPEEAVGMSGMILENLDEDMDHASNPANHHNGGEHPHESPQDEMDRWEGDPAELIDKWAK